MKLKAMFICLVVLVFALTGCKSSVTAIPKPSTYEVKEITTTITVRDTVLKIEADSSYYKAYIECVNGKPVIKNPVSKPGKNLNPPKVVLDNNILKVDCEAEAREKFVQWKEKFTKDFRSKTIEVPYAVPTPLSQFTVVQIWFGRVFIFLLLAFIIGGILRYKKII